MSERRPVDVHRAQITYDASDTATGEVQTGRIRPANRGRSRVPDAPGDKGDDRRRGGDAGWRFIADERVRPGIGVRLAEPAETRLRQDRKPREDRLARRPSAA
jgi:hypothetical protein